MILENIADYKIILGSGSPRRKELLSGLDIDFEVASIPNVDESYPDFLKREEIPLYLAQKKAEAYKNRISENTLLITADTIVYLDGKVYGKPDKESEAEQMLRALSGKTHEVITGVCLTNGGKQKSFHAVSRVRFAVLTEEEISYYVKKYKPFDKAGSYGVQEWIGYIGVEHLEGSFYNIMGLPVRMLYQHLKNGNESL